MLQSRDVVDESDRFAPGDRLSLADWESVNGMASEVNIQRIEHGTVGKSAPLCRDV
jgi:hypothetical protein